MTALDIYEVTIRGGAAGLALLLSVALARAGPGSVAARLGALFALGAAAYTLVSSPTLWAVMGPAREGLRLLATYNAILFWWFATALFDDQFKWRWWRLAPALAMTVIIISRAAWPSFQLLLVTRVAMQGLAFALLAHTLTLAIRGFAVDLIEPRRRFRVVFALLTGTLGIAIATAELAQLVAPLPDVMNRVQAVALFALTSGFAIWVLGARADLFPSSSRSALAATDKPTGLSPEDASLAARLEAAMESQIYLEPGLTVSALAKRLGAPEHRLRKLINAGLGYRNFAAFLNERRIADAKAALSDPIQARRQILLLALDLGYGSIGPFNRAFRECTGQSPTEFRKAALSPP